MLKLFRAFLVHPLTLLCQMLFGLVISAGKRVSSAMDGKLKAIHAGMTILKSQDYVI